MSTSQYYSTAIIKVVATTIQNTQVQISISTPCSSGNACVPSNIPIDVSITSNQDVMLVSLYVTATYQNTPNTVVAYEGVTGTDLSTSVTAVANAPYTPNSPCYTAVNVPVQVQAVVCVPYLLSQGFGISARNSATFSTALNIYNIDPSQLPSKFPQACTLVTGSTTATINVNCMAPQPSDSSSQSGMITSSTTLQVGVPTPSTAVSSTFQLPSKYYAGAVVIPTSQGMYLYEVVFSPQLFANGIVNLACGTQTNTCYDSSGNLYTPVDVWIHIPLSTIGLNDVTIKLFTITNINNIPTIVVVNQNIGSLTVSGNIPQLFENAGWTYVQSLTSGYYSYTYLVNNNMYISVVPSGTQPTNGEMQPAVLILAIPSSQQIVPPAYEVDMNLTAHGISANNQPYLALIGLDYPNYSTYIVPTNLADKLTCTGIASSKNPFTNTAVLMIGLPLSTVYGASSVSVGYVDVQDNNVGSAISVGAFIDGDYASGAAVDIVSPTDKRHCTLGSDTVSMSNAGQLVLYILTPSTTSLQLDAGYPLIIDVVVNYNNAGGNLVAQAVYRVTITPKIPYAQITNVSYTDGNIDVSDAYIKNVYCGRPPSNCPQCPAPQICILPISQAPFYVIDSFDLTINYTPSSLSIPNTINIASIQNLPINSNSFTAITSAQPLSTVQVKACLGNQALGIGSGIPRFDIYTPLNLPAMQISANVWNCSPGGMSGANPTTLVLYSPAYLTVNGNNVTLSGKEATTTWNDVVFVFAVPHITSSGDVALTFNDPDCASVSSASPTLLNLTTGAPSTSVNLPPNLPSNVQNALSAALSSASLTYNIVGWFPYVVCGPLILLVKGSSTMQSYSIGEACFIAYIIPTTENVYFNPQLSTDACNNTASISINNNMYVNISPSQIQSLMQSVLSSITKQIMIDLQSNQATIRVDIPSSIAQILTIAGITIGVSMNVGASTFTLTCNENNDGSYTCVLPQGLQQALLQALQSSGGQAQLCVYDQAGSGISACTEIRVTITISVPSTSSTTAASTYKLIFSASTLTPKVSPDKQIKIAYTLVFVQSAGTSS
jgi:hypothetical protein